jgi:hypothetical protein
MKIAQFKPWHLSILLLICLAPFALADNVNISIDKNQNWGNTLGGELIGPYNVSVNGSPIPTLVICDDFATTTYLPSSWTAAVTPYSSLGSASGLAGTKFGGTTDALTKYNEIAWLSLQLLDPTVSSCPQGGPCNAKGDIQFAIWQVFDPTGAPFARLGGTVDLANAQFWLDKAAANAGSVDTSGFVIYTPNRVGAAQEFISRMDESTPATWLLGLNLLALLGLVGVFRHRIFGAKS